MRFEKCVPCEGRYYSWNPGAQAVDQIEVKTIPVTRCPEAALAKLLAFYCSTERLSDEELEQLMNAVNSAEAAP